MAEGYDVEVKLLAITGLVEDGEVIKDDRERITPDNEQLIEYAGRLCYATEDKVGTAPGWIQRRISDGHESIIEHASATFYIRASRVLTHELVRHRLASYSQRSQRYVKENEPRYITPPECEIPPATGQSKEEWERNLWAHNQFHSVIGECWRVYRGMLQAGIKPEIARYVLPGACETQIICTWNFRELRHIFKLRTSKRALPEMQVVAGKIREIMKQQAPEVFADL